MPQDGSLASAAPHGPPLMTLAGLPDSRRVACTYAMVALTAAGGRRGLACSNRGATGLLGVG
jgi:hypothetical protein